MGTNGGGQPLSASLLFSNGKQEAQPIGPQRLLRQAVHQELSLHATQDFQRNLGNERSKLSLFHKLLVWLKYIAGYMFDERVCFRHY
jgi:hypothetical protein